MTEAGFTPAMPADELSGQSAKAIELGGHQLLLCRFEDRIYALENRCSHADEPLACGRIRLGWIACPAHGSRFDLATGEPLNPPASAPIRTYPARVSGGMIEVAL